MLNSSSGSSAEKKLSSAEVMDRLRTFTNKNAELTNALVANLASSVTEKFAQMGIQIELKGLQDSENVQSSADGADKEEEEEATVEIQAMQLLQDKPLAAHNFSSSNPIKKCGEPLAAHKFSSSNPIKKCGEPLAAHKFSSSNPIKKCGGIGLPSPIGRFQSSSASSRGAAGNLSFSPSSNRPRLGSNTIHVPYKLDTTPQTIAIEIDLKELADRNRTCKTTTIVRSSPKKFGGFVWSLEAELLSSGKFGLFLHCLGHDKDTKWKGCTANGIFRVFNNVDNIDHAHRFISKVFEEKYPRQGTWEMPELARLLEYVTEEKPLLTASVEIAILNVILNNEN